MKIDTNTANTGNTKVPVLAGFAFVALLALIGLYFMGANVADETTITEVQVNGPSINSTDPGDTADDIEVDLEALDIDNLETTDPEVEAVLETEIE
tara:strand:- start:400 stop:687 length:288 start_codon:yes stop_codon:yes gene_type:complete